MSKSRLRSISVELFELAGRHTALHASEASMEPVPSQFRDQVLYLKHNLNAAAIGSLRGTADNSKRSPTAPEADERLHRRSRPICATALNGAYFSRSISFAWIPSKPPLLKMMITSPLMQRALSLSMMESVEGS